MKDAAVAALSSDTRPRTAYGALVQAALAAGNPGSDPDSCYTLEMDQPQKATQRTQYQGPERRRSTTPYTGKERRRLDWPFPSRPREPQPSEGDKRP